MFLKFLLWLNLLPASKIKITNQPDVYLYRGRQRVM